jgi:hypothetical protein
MSLFTGVLLSAAPDRTTLRSDQLNETCVSEFFRTQESEILSSKKPIAWSEKKAATESPSFVPDAPRCCAHRGRADPRSRPIPQSASRTSIRISAPSGEPKVVPPAW